MDYLKDIYPFLPNIIFWAILVIVLGGIYIWMSKKYKSTKAGSYEGDYKPEMIRHCGGIMDGFTALTEVCAQASERPVGFDDDEFKSIILEKVSEINAELHAIYGKGEDMIPEKYNDLHGQLLTSLLPVEDLTEYLQSHMDELQNIGADALFDRLEAAGMEVDKALTSLIEGPE